MLKTTYYIMLVFIIVMITGCGQESPREAFREKLGGNIDKLIYKLGYLGTDEQEEVETSINWLVRYIGPKYILNKFFSQQLFSFMP